MDAHSQRKHCGWTSHPQLVKHIFQHWSYINPGILMGFSWDSQIPSGKRLHNYGKSPFFMGKSTISMVIFNSKLLVYQRVKHPTGSGERIVPRLAHHCVGTAWLVDARGHACAARRLAVVLEARGHGPILGHPKIMSLVWFFWTLDDNGY